MSMIERDWVATFRARATSTTYLIHKIGKDKDDKPAKSIWRMKTEWLTLPGGRGRPVMMTPAHGHVLAAFRVHSEFQDLDNDFITSKASANQLSEICFWSVSQVEQILSDLKQVGYIVVQRRANRSNLTTVFREPGHFDVPTKASDMNSYEDDERPAKRPKAAKRKADHTHLLTDDETWSWPRLSRMRRSSMRSIHAQASP